MEQPFSATYGLATQLRTPPTEPSGLSPPGSPHGLHRKKVTPAMLDDIRTSPKLSGSGGFTPAWGPRDISSSYSMKSTTAPMKQDLHSSQPHFAETQKTTIKRPQGNGVGQVMLNRITWDELGRVVINRSDSPASGDSSPPPPPPPPASTKQSHSRTRSTREGGPRDQNVSLPPTGAAPPTRPPRPESSASLSTRLASQLNSSVHHSEPVGLAPPAGIMVGAIGPPPLTPPPSAGHDSVDFNFAPLKPLDLGIKMDPVQSTYKGSSNAHYLPPSTEEKEKEHADGGAETGPFAENGQEYEDDAEVNVAQRVSRSASLRKGSITKLLNSSQTALKGVILNHSRSDSVTDSAAIAGEDDSSGGGTGATTTTTASTTGAHLRPARPASPGGTLRPIGQGLRASISGSSSAGGGSLFRRGSSAYAPTAPAVTVAPISAQNPSRLPTNLLPLARRTAHVAKTPGYGWRLNLLEKLERSMGAFLTIQEAEAILAIGEGPSETKAARKLNHRKSRINMPASSTERSSASNRAQGSSKKEDKSTGFFGKMKRAFIPTSPTPENIPVQPPKPNGMFGVSLSVSAEYGFVTSMIAGQRHDLPCVCFSTVEEIYRRGQGMKVPGLLHLAGEANRVAKLVHIYDSPPDYGEHHDLSIESIHNVTSLLKKYLRDLPEPILDPRLWRLYCAACLDSSNPLPNRISCAQIILRLLPTPNFSLLVYLVAFLSQMPLFPENRLTLESVSLIFGPAAMAARAKQEPSTAAKLSRYVTGSMVITGPTENHEASGLNVKKSQDGLLWLLDHWSSVADGLLDPDFDVDNEDEGDARDEELESEKQQPQQQQQQQQRPPQTYNNNEDMQEGSSVHDYRQEDRPRQASVASVHTLEIQPTSPILDIGAFGVHQPSLAAGFLQDHDHEEERVDVPASVRATETSQKLSPIQNLVSSFDQRSDLLVADKRPASEVHHHQANGTSIRSSSPIASLRAQSPAGVRRPASPSLLRHEIQPTQMLAVAETAPPKPFALMESIDSPVSDYSAPPTPHISRVLENGENKTHSLHDGFYPVAQGSPRGSPVVASNLPAAVEETNHRHHEDEPMPADVHGLVPAHAHTHTHAPASGSSRSSDSSLHPHSLNNSSKLVHQAPTAALLEPTAVKVADRNGYAHEMPEDEFGPLGGVAPDSSVLGDVMEFENTPLYNSSGHPAAAHDEQQAAPARKARGLVRSKQERLKESEEIQETQRHEIQALWKQLTDVEVERAQDKKVLESLSLEVKNLKAELTGAHTKSVGAIPSEDHKHALSSLEQQLRDSQHRAEKAEADLAQAHKQLAAESAEAQTQITTLTQSLNSIRAVLGGHL